LLANTNERYPSIGLLAHMDTSPEMTGKGVIPLIYENYDGGDIPLNVEKNINLSPKDFPILKEKKGKTIVTADGDTLLGADDKAGITIILGVLESLIFKQIPHGKVVVAFTCDEEIGRGTEKFNYNYFDVDFAYTVDGSEINNVEFECFNAAEVTVEIQGLSVHPGTAKGKMVNSILLATEYQNLLKSYPSPENTDNYQGFIHINEGKLGVEHSTLKYILREHDKNKFEIQKEIMIRNAQIINDKNGSERVTVTIKDQYKNMEEYFMGHRFIIDLAYKALSQHQIIATSNPIRGGTDGAVLSANGVLCPNLGTGGYNFHGKYEFLVLEEMEEMIEVITTLLTISKSAI
jgi:tripeptide aminopeptidase